ncbi:hypothetical protein P4O66_005677 [Electrophorus voltai]|uniref:Ig-like domain-containing protein n=1 Tax=Electrophorus voltai TaxID=2609070 RepID=A0AAD8ZLL2_9TELE|nr:hypothetical protein P4O66_005677 [Electrophorus voltai]
MGIAGCLVLPWKCLVVVALRLLFLVPAGVPARSGDSYLKDNITVRQGDSAVLKPAKTAVSCGGMDSTSEVLSGTKTLAADPLSPEAFVRFSFRQDEVCNVDSKVSRVAWLNRTTILFTGSEKWSLDPRVVLLNNTAVTEYSIKILDVNLHDEGPYVCSILTNKKPESTKVHLIVQEISPPTVEVFITHAAEITEIVSKLTQDCFAPELTFQIKKAVMLVMEALCWAESLERAWSYAAACTRASIVQVVRRMAGRQTPTLMETRMNVYHNVKVYTPPLYLLPGVPARIVNISRDITVNEGSNISLMCLAIGRPEPSIIWKYHSARGQRFVSEGEYVEMTAITKEQSGSYECISSNDISPPDVRTVQVTVNYPPVISRARSTGTPVGQRGVLQCEASAVPLADFQWYKEDRRLFNGLNGVKIENKGKQSMLIFFNVSEADYGNYTCVAMNTLGITNASIILYGAGVMHDVNSAAPSPLSSFHPMLILILFYLSRF